MNFLVILATTATFITGSPCAAMHTGTNHAAYATQTAPVATFVRYVDRGHLVYDFNAPMPDDNAGWSALHNVEQVVSDGPTGARLALACVN